MATFLVNQAKDQLIDFAKKQLLEQLEEKLKQGDAGIDSLFANLKNKLIDSAFLKTILGAICKLKQEDALKLDLKEKIGKIEFSEKLEEMKKTMPEMGEQIDALPEKLKEKLNKLINVLITCDAPPTTVVEPAPAVVEPAPAVVEPAPAVVEPAPAVATTGGYKQRDRKKKRRQKTKKRIYKKSRGRRQYSRK